jgi:hypothetical protein
MGFVATKRRQWLAGGLLLACLAAPIVSAPGGEPLEAGFANPPQEARLRCYWWWLNGNTDEAAITRDLEQMKAKGYGGALLVDAGGAEQRGNTQVPAGPMFGSPRWRELYRHAVREAARLGLEISLNIQSGWNLGGPAVKPEQAAKLLTYSRIAAKGPADFKESLPQPPTRNGFYRDIAVLAYPLSGKPHPPIRQLAAKSAAQELGMSMPSGLPLLQDSAAEPGEADTQVADIRNLTQQMQTDGTLAWSVPEGNWEILRIGYTSSGAKISTSSETWQGLALDYLDRKALEAYWHENVDPLIEDARPYVGRALRYLVTDSWELGGVNWSAPFRDEFRARRGYDPVPWLPVIADRIVGDRETSNRFLTDMRRTVADMVISQHYAVFGELAARAGLEIHPESGGPHGAPIDALETLGVSAFPQTEFWARSATHRVRDDERFFVKQAASAAHTYGKTLVAAEGMTSIGPQWEETIWNNLKPTFDQAACEGLNRLIWHTFTSSPKSMGVPGQEYFAGTHLNPNVTWWNQAGAFLSYINRSQFLLQQGLPVSDVIYYYGDHVPNFVRTKSADPAKVLPGYDYDVADEFVLTHRMSVRDGRIVLPDGTSYRLLALPDTPGISVAAIRAVRKLVEDGATVLGPRPKHATGMQGDEEVRAIAAGLWPGKIRTGQTARQLLASLKVPPDFESEPGTMDYIHRQSGGTDLYFIRNTHAEAVNAEVMLRVQGKAPELWHPDTGKIEMQAVYTLTEDGRTRLPLRLEPYGSVFVVFRRPAARHLTEVRPAADVRLNADGTADVIAETAGRYTAKTDRGESVSATVPAGPAPVAIEGPWSVKFTPGWGAPASVNFTKLQSWTDNEDPGVRYYSGTATYSTRFTVTDVSPAVLDLGDVRELAQVRVNGHDLGILWKKPFAVSLEGVLRPGQNDLDIAVTNLWPNRLIGDQRLPPEQRRTHTNITKFRADSPLMPSGLLGPVTLHRRYTARFR